MINTDEIDKKIIEHNIVFETTIKPKKTDKLSEMIENIEQLGADARFENNNENYDKLKIKLESIKIWSEEALKLLEKKSD